MGDIRNKLAKIERAKAEKSALESWLRHQGIDPNPARPQRSLHDQRCPCGLNVYETQLWQCGDGGLYCRVCMPLKYKLEIFGHMVNVGLNFDPADHGEELASGDQCDTGDALTNYPSG